MAENTVFISEKADAPTIEAIEKLGCKVIPLPAYRRLSVPVNSHADMLFFGIGNLFYTFSEYYAENEKIFKCFPQIIPLDCTPSEKYPSDIPLNAFTLSGTDGKTYLIAKEKNTAPDIRKQFENSEILNVSQGYAHCSAAVITERAIITADCGIASVCGKIGADVLLIAGGGIAIDGYDYGFIGGAGAKIGEKYVFFGNVTLHPNGDEILNFVKNHIDESIITCAGPLCDFGGAICING